MKPCPSCGGVLERVPDAVVGVPTFPRYYVVERGLEIRETQRLVLACTSCEYCEVVK